MKLINANHGVVVVVVVVVVKSFPVKETGKNTHLFLNKVANSENSK